MACHRWSALEALLLAGASFAAPAPARASCTYTCGVLELVGYGVLGVLGPGVTEGGMTLIERDLHRGQPDGGWAAARFVVGGLFAAGGVSMTVAGAALSDEAMLAAGIGGTLGAGLMLVRGALMLVELDRRERGPPVHPTIRVLAGPAGIELRGRF